MVSLILGVVLGFAITIWYVAYDLQYDFDSNISVNIIIACSTLIATSIHFVSIKRQRSDRVWEINKDILLQLASSLSKVIEEIDKAQEYEFDAMQGIEHETGVKYEYNKDVYQNFTDSTFDVLNVYKPLMSPKLILAIEHLKKIDKNVTERVNEGELMVFEAYDTILAEHKKLQIMLNSFIKKISGIKHT